MQIAIPFNSLDSEKIYFTNRTDNTVVPGGGFYRIIYADEHVSLIGLPITISMSSLQYPNKDNNDYKFDVFCEELQKKVMAGMTLIMQTWKKSFNKFSDLPMTFGPTVSVVKQAAQKALLMRNQKYDNNMNFIFKCSGLYDTEQEIGITYRLFAI